MVCVLHLVRQVISVFSSSEDFRFHHLSPNHQRVGFREVCAMRRGDRRVGISGWDIAQWCATKMPDLELRELRELREHRPQHWCQQTKV